ncbi:cationic amino acid transporter 3-like isoform X1 [Bos javanicus]|uniref:cationic amino acid transporter 3-like isoform X1 n=1 Tax=Bos javanicus TaxID=9906 RepID=UPI002AA7CB4B|nr:cationic amino acid transporter 3-like isoform X1 [Bos javanicus]
MSTMLGQYLRQFGQKLVRRKPQFREEPESSETPPPNTLDLVVIGLDNMLGAGIYILIGGVAKYVAGPAIILFLLVAGLTTLLSGLCYVELAAGVEKPGTVYFISYVTMGQLYAFITGWNLLLYLIIAIACIAQAWSSIFDNLIGNHISEALEGTFSLQMPYFLASFPDFLALGLVLLLTGLLALRVYESTLIYKVFTGLNILVLSFIILSGFIKGDLHNWKLTEQDYTLAAAGSGDAYSLLSIMFIMSQLTYAMAEDGLLFRGLAWIPAHTDAHTIIIRTTYARIIVHTVAPTGTPIMAVLVPGTLAAVMALLFDFTDLVDLMSFQSLVAHSLVTFSVLVLRYQPAQNGSKKEKTEEETETKPEVEGGPLESEPEAGTSNILQILWFPPSTIPTRKSGQIVYGCASLVVLLLIILSLILYRWSSQVFSGDPVLTTVAVLLLLLITGVTVIIWRQPQNPSTLPFRVPALPALFLVSTFMNVYLMIQMTTRTWAQFGIWMAIGFAIYFGYGIQHSLGENNDQQPAASTSQT